MSNDDVFKSPLRLRFGKSPKKSEKKGLMTAVEDFLTTDLGQSWEIHKIYKNNNGLTVLKNRNYQK